MSDDENNIFDFPTIKGMPNPGPLDKALDLIPVERTKEVVTARDDGNDYETARAEIHDALSELKTATKEMGDLAHQAQHARGYEVLGQLLEKRVAAAQALIDLRNAAQVEAGAKTINNNLMISSADMLDMLKNKTKE